MEIPIANPNTNHVFGSSLPRERWCAHQFLYQFHGFWLPGDYLQSTQQVLENFKPLPTDIILASFPKTGTTWLKSLLHSITRRSDKDRSLNFNHPQELIPSLETNLFLRNDKIPEIISPKDPQKSRILSTHIPYQKIDEILNSSDCKLVYVTRNPKDTLVSMWHFVQKGEAFAEDPWELKTAVDQFCRGVLAFGPYYDHVMGYRGESLRRPDKVFFVTFEELKEDPFNCVKKMGEFLGCPFEGENETGEVEEIVTSCSFETLSNYEVNKSSDLPDGFPLPYNSFFRKGEVGDSLNYLDEEMIQKIDAITKEKFHCSGFEYGI